MEDPKCIVRNPIRLSVGELHSKESGGTRSRDEICTSGAPLVREFRAWGEQESSASQSSMPRLLILRAELIVPPFKSATRSRQRRSRSSARDRTIMRVKEIGRQRMKEARILGHHRPVKIMGMADLKPSQPIYATTPLCETMARREGFEPPTLSPEPGPVVRGRHPCGPFTALSSPPTRIRHASFTCNSSKFVCIMPRKVTWHPIKFG